MVFWLDVRKTIALVPIGEGLAGDLESYYSPVAVHIWISVLIHPAQIFFVDKPASLNQVFIIPFTLRFFF